MPEDQFKENFGPIPESTEYVARFDETQDYEQNPVWWNENRPIKSWGKYATFLEPVNESKLQGRSGFYIHGGDYPGSNGCIDLTDNNGNFHRYMRLYKRNLTLKVKYN